MFYIGQVFDTDYPLEAVDFCMENGFKIIQMPDGKFQIVDVPDDTNARRNELQALLNETDWYVVRQAETSKAIPPDILKNRAAWRSELSDLK